MLLNICPVSARDYTPNSSSRNIIFSHGVGGKRSATRSERSAFSNFDDLGLVQFCSAIIATNRVLRISSFLSVHIGYIIGLGAKKQMTRVKAGSVIAFMKDLKWAAQIKAEIQMRRYTMRFRALPQDGHDSVSFAVLRTIEYPTVTNDLFSPKQSFFWVYKILWHMSNFITIDEA